jgi:2-oxoglutarate ferredoxin oxidoreductase subunit beta
MTGGQMAPTTIPGMKSSTSPLGRDVSIMGNPIDMSALVAQLKGTYYVTRQSVHKPANVRKAKNAIRKAFEFQQLKKGTCLVEIVSNCNTNWRLTPIQANNWLEENMLKYYPLGDIKVNGELVKK